MATSKKDMDAQEREWMAESDMRTLIDAEKIRADPPRLKRALEKAKEMKAALMKVTK